MFTMTATSHVPHQPRRGMHPLRWITDAFATHRQRLHLEDLDAHLLEDIGIDRYTARSEAQRSFWDLPR
jgi:uncharacterized protein YjiS (DUF1127 family)